MIRITCARLLEHFMNTNKEQITLQFCVQIAMKILEHYTYTGYKTSVYKRPSPLTRQYMITTSTKPEYSTIF